MKILFLLLLLPFLNGCEESKDVVLKTYELGAKDYTVMQSKHEDTIVSVVGFNLPASIKDDGIFKSMSEVRFDYRYCTYDAVGGCSTWSIEYQQKTTYGKAGFNYTDMYSPVIGNQVRTDYYFPDVIGFGNKNQFKQSFSSEQNNGNVLKVNFQNTAYQAITSFDYYWICCADNMQLAELVYIDAWTWEDDVNTYWFNQVLFKNVPWLQGIINWFTNLGGWAIGAILSTLVIIVLIGALLPQLFVSFFTLVLKGIITIITGVFGAILAIPSLIKKRNNKDK